MIRSRSYIAVPPGATIKEQLDSRGMSQKEFAVRMDMSEKHISKLINGEVQLTPDVALRLETVLGVPARFWNNLEAYYREIISKAEAENTMDADIKMAKLLPYSEMAESGWIPKTRDPIKKVENLRKFFELVNLSLLDNQQIARIACRRLAVTEKSDLAVMAWTQEVRIIARNIPVAQINIKELVKAVQNIRKLTCCLPADFCPLLKKYLADSGIALVFLHHLKGSFLQGATFLDGKKVVIGMTARGRDADKFWFSLFHELGHIVLRHTALEKGTSDKEELAADLWARDQLISAEDFERFCKNNDYSESSVIQFSEKLGIAPGIVVGRLQRDGIIKYSRLNHLKEKYTILS